LFRLCEDNSLKFEGPCDQIEFFRAVFFFFFFLGETEYIFIFRSTVAEVLSMVFLMFSLPNREYVLVILDGEVYVGGSS